MPNRQNLNQVLEVSMKAGVNFPVLVSKYSWIPYMLPNRWAQSLYIGGRRLSTIKTHLYKLSALYTWAEQIEGECLDTLLLTSDLRSEDLIDSLISFLHDWTRNKQGAISNNSYNQYNRTICEFLRWALYKKHRGGEITEFNSVLARTYDMTLEEFRSRRMRPQSDYKRRDLDIEDIETIERTIKPIILDGGQLAHREGVFDKTTILRNWLMVRTCFELGIRKGELLKLTLDDLPKGRNTTISIRRRANDPNDPRRPQPRVKTAERDIPASPELLYWLQKYTTCGAPFGRPYANHDYIFLSTNSEGRKAEPLSVTSANKILTKVGYYSGIEDLTWHRFRHTWASRIAEALQNDPTKVEKLMRMGGWRSLDSALTYFGNVEMEIGFAHLVERREAILYPNSNTSEQTPS